MEDLKKLKQFLLKYGRTKPVYQEMAKKIIKVEIELTAHNNGFANFGRTMDGIIGGGIAGLLVAFCFFGFFYYGLGIESNLIAWITLFIFILGPIFGLSFVNWLKTKKEEILRTKKEKINKEYTAKLAQVYNTTNKAIAFKYASPFIVEQLIDYFETGRCDTLKESINLYEQERIQYEQTKLLRDMHKHTKIAAAATNYLAFDTFMNNLGI